MDGIGIGIVWFRLARPANKSSGREGSIAGRGSRRRRRRMMMEEEQQKEQLRLGVGEND